MYNNFYLFSAAIAFCKAVERHVEVHGNKERDQVARKTAETLAAQIRSVSLGGAIRLGDILNALATVADSDDCGMSYWFSHNGFRIGCLGLTLRGGMQEEIAGKDREMASTKPKKVPVIALRVPGTPLQTWR